MPAKEIKELRQSGRLDEALVMAQNELNAQPDNIWGKRNISWVYYEYIKKYAHDFDYEGFIENLTKLKELNLPENEVMIFDTSAWQIASGVFTLQKTEPVDYSRINQVFEIIKGFHFTRPSDSYSLLYKAFHKGYQNWSQYLPFADWWNFDNFRPEDYKKEEYNGRQIMALAEQAYIAYSKSLLEGEALDAFGTQRRIDKSKIQEFLPKLDTIIEAHPEYQYPPYFKAKLLLALGDDDNALSAFLPFAKQKRNDFWVWELMAEIFKDDEDLRFACYCKALSLKAPSDFLIKTREAFAKLLIEKEMYDEAKTEIEQIIAIRKNHKWKLSNQLSNWSRQDWYANATVKESNTKLYKSHLVQAEEILYQDVPEEVVAVEFVNRDKKILNFVKDQSYNGFCSYKGFNINPEIADIIKVRLKAKGNEGFYQLLTLKPLENGANVGCHAIKEVQGLVTIREGQNFGFLEDVFIPPFLVIEQQLENGDEVNCKAILSFNKKKKEWRWKSFDVMRS